jgi:hypothetical protein
MSTETDLQEETEGRVGGSPPTKRRRKSGSPSPGTRITARYSSICATCRAGISPGDSIGRLPRTVSRYGDPGWICIPCLTTAAEPGQPSLRDVVARTYLRWARGKPISLNKVETEVLANELLKADADLTPDRRCEAGAVDDHPSTPWREWDQSEAPIAQIVGYMLDSISFDFSCNLRTRTAIRLLCHIIGKTCTCGEHVPQSLVCVYEMMNVVSSWEALDWRSPLRKKGIAAFSQRYARTALPPLL